MVNIFMDDLRPCPAGWLLARTTLECVDLLTENQGNVNCLSLDQDMSELDNDGYWMVVQMVALRLSVKKVFIHTSNPTGRIKMVEYLTSAIQDGRSAAIDVYAGPFPFETDVTEGESPDWE